MKYLITVIIFLLIVFPSQSQTYEIGALIGGSNYIGDIGKTNYIAPNNLAFGGLFKWNRSKRHSFRFSLLYAELEGDDKDASSARRQSRDLSFRNTVLEASAGLEFTFWDFDMYDGKPAASPYLYTGLTYFKYDALFLDTDKRIKKFDTAWDFAIPIVLGYKTSVGTKLVLAFEIGARYTFTDNLDGTNPNKSKSSDNNLKFGNINSQDWYVFTGISLAFSFGRQPCYCHF